MTGSKRDCSRRLRACQRRLNFASESRYLWDRLFSVEPLRGRLDRDRLQYLPRIPDLLLSGAYDLLECIRYPGTVASLGDRRSMILSVDDRIEQPRRHLGFWHDASRHSSVGLHLGIDVLETQDGYAVIEVNLDAAMRPPRRVLYQAPIDPIFDVIAAKASSLGYSRVVFCHRMWTAEARSEVLAAGREHGIETIAAAMRYLDSGSTPLAGLPRRLPEDTFFVFFNGRHSSLDYWIHNKYVSASWLGESLDATRGDGPRVFVPASSSEPMLPEPFPPPEFPNLVVKLPGSDRGKGILMGRFLDLDHLRSELGLKGGSSLPRQMRETIRQRIEQKLFQEGQPIYQQFVPPRTTVDGNPYIFRVHILVSPVCTEFLSAHKVVADQKLADSPLSPGLVGDPGRFIVNYSRGASYVGLEPGEDESIRAIASSMGKAIQHGIEKKFVTTP